MITAHRDDTGKLRGFTKITRDLTEKRNAELYAKQSHEDELTLNKANERAKEIQLQSKYRNYARRFAVVKNVLLIFLTIARMGQSSGTR